jgi:hypothetical protein
MGCLVDHHSLHRFLERQAMFMHAGRLSDPFDDFGGSVLQILLFHPNSERYHVSDLSSAMW